MQTAQSTEQHRTLEQLAGQWEGTETVLPGPWNPNGGRAKCTIDARVEVDGYFLLMDYFHEEPERSVAFHAHGVIGWDAQKSAHTMHWFDRTLAVFGS